MTSSILQLWISTLNLNSRLVLFFFTTCHNPLSRSGTATVAYGSFSKHWWMVPMRFYVTNGFFSSSKQHWKNSTTYLEIFSYIEVVASSQLCSTSNAHHAPWRYSLCWCVSKVGRGIALLLTLSPRVISWRRLASCTTTHVASLPMHALPQVITLTFARSFHFSGVFVVTICILPHVYSHLVTNYGHSSILFSALW